MLIRESGRSTDFISPSFGYGCLYNCTYCYMKRHLPEGLTIATNIGDILTAINQHAYFTHVDKPNQTHDKYITYDISCNEDFALHAKYHDWQRIFEFFVDHPIAFGSFATKYVNEAFLNYNSKQKIRVRFSLMPQIFANELEPNTSKIIDRIKAIDKFIDAGYDVHINFSPVIVTDNWLKHYEQLFQLVDENVKHKDIVKAEVIFLTHNADKHLYNINNNLSGESLIWNPDIQETKQSQYGGINLRYNHILKTNYIYQFLQIHKDIIPWNYVRYIF